MTTLSENQANNSCPDFLSQFQGYLKTQIELSSFESTSKETARRQTFTKVKVTVSNASPTSLEWPRIVFTGVGLSVGSLGEAGNISPHQMSVHAVNPDGPPGMQRLPWEQDDKFKGLLQTRFRRIHGQDFPDVTPDETSRGEVLFPGQAIIFEMDVAPELVPFLQFRVEGTISRRHLFHHQEILVMPETLTRPIAVAALRDLNALELHRVLDSVISSMPGFNSDTRLAEVQAYSGALTNGMAEIKSIQETINKIWYKHKFFWFRAVLRAAFICLDRVSAALTRMKDAIGSSDPEKIATESSALRVLKGETSQFDHMTEELMSRHNITDEEVNYRYRGR
ncbi:MAG: hypothetical protein HYY29_06075 [Chloroflexi bacterium]|nr:hypothetical protein [Chloroflexota bacterium]